MSKKTKKQKSRSKTSTMAPHTSDCSVNSAPAIPAGDCDGGPSASALDFARGLIKRARNPKATEEERTRQIAEMFDSARRVTEARSEIAGSMKGFEEARQAADNTTLTGILARIQYQIENARIKPETFTISQGDALAIGRFLERNGFNGYKRPDPQGRMTFTARMVDDNAKAT